VNVSYFFFMELASRF